jgi:pimeloyl-ACP methyl ester carboxylesterase
MNRFFQRHTVALDDVRLHYVIAGSGEPVVLHQGWPQTWFEWRRIVQNLISWPVANPAQP